MLTKKNIFTDLLNPRDLSVFYEYLDLMKQAVSEKSISEELLIKINAKRIEIANDACRFFLKVSEIDDFNKTVKEFSDLVSCPEKVEIEKKKLEKAAFIESLPTKFFDVKYREYIDDPFSSDLGKRKMLFIGSRMICDTIPAKTALDAKRILEEKYRNKTLPNTTGGNKLYIHSIVLKNISINDKANEVTTKLEMSEDKKKETGNIVEEEKEKENNKKNV